MDLVAKITVVAMVIVLAMFTVVTMVITKLTVRSKQKGSEAQGGLPPGRFMERYSLRGSLGRVLAWKMLKP